MKDYNNNVVKYQNLLSLQSQTFVLSVVEFNYYFSITEDVKRVEMGALIQPIKVRPAWNEYIESSFETNISINAAIANRLNKKYNWFFVAAPGVTTVELNENNSLYRPDLVQSEKPVSSLNQSAFTMWAGFLYSIDKVQISLLYGADYLAYNKSSFQWKYQNVVWISIGIGVDIFSFGKVNKPEN